MSKNNKEAAPPLETRSVKHTFTDAETRALFVGFRNAYANVTSAESDFEAVKSQHKAKIMEAQARVDRFNAQLQAGFEMRDKECVVVFRPKDRKKDYYVAPDPLDEQGRDLAGLLAAVGKGEVAPALTEEMTGDDFEQELLQAEADFESKTTIPLWAAGDDAGKIVVGRLGKRWYAAVRGNVGGQRADERMDSEQKGCKDREGAVAEAGKRAIEWLERALGKETAAGFVPAIVSALEGERGKVE